MRSLIFIVTLLTASVFAETQTPADNFGELFHQVQLQKVFPDGKTFVDALPKDNPATIMSDYAKAKPTTKADLQAFVLQHFTLPTTKDTAAETERLPLRKHIANLWQHLQRPASTQENYSSALPLPEPYIVPGGRFREVYYWDTYFTMLGLAADGRDDLVESMLKNFESLIDRYGHIPNGTRTYYLSRSQPPFFALMLTLSKDTTKTSAHLKALKAEHDFWMLGASCVNAATSACKRVVKMDDGSLLNRYWDDRDTPREESYAEDVTTASNSQNKADIYRHLRAGAESGWDFSSRWFVEPDKIQTIHTTDIVPIDLNSLLWFQEKEIATLCKALSDATCVSNYEKQSAARAKAIRHYLWIAKEKRFADYDFKTKHATQIISAATLYPLFVGLANHKEAAAVASTTRKQLLAEGGLRTTLLSTGQQWDKPNGWAPLQWIAVKGLDAYGEKKLAKEISKRWLITVNQAYRETGKLLEKYDVENRKPGGGGEYPLQDGFGWTNGVVRAMIEKYPDLDPDK